MNASPCALLRACVATLLLALGSFAGPLPLHAQGSSASPSEGAARALVGQGNFEAAATMVEALLEAEPDKASLWGLLGVARMGQDDLPAAKKALLRARELDSTQTATDYNLGILYARQGDLDRAFATLQALKRDGRFDLTRLGLDSRAEALRADSRYASLFPTAAEFAAPFVEEGVVVLQERRGEAANDWYGWIARNVGDVDGDGVMDWTTSAPNAASGEQATAGKVYTYSGRGGALLWTAVGTAGAQLGMGIEAAGDPNGDGVRDVIAGAPGIDRAWVYSGDDGRVLLELAGEQAGEKFGGKVTDLGDVDGDGHDDVLVGAPANDAGFDDAGAAYLFSGADGQLLRVLHGTAAGAAFGSAAAGAMTPDGPVFLVGAPGDGPAQAGRVYVYTDLSGEPRHVFDADATGSSLGGMFLSVIGDLDADGHWDYYLSDWSNNALGRSTGRVYLYSGADGSPLWTLTGEAAGDGFGIGPADVGDVDGDGHADMLIGAWQHASAAPSGGKVYLYSGRDASLMRTFTSRVMGETFGFDATGLGDVDGDGRIDYLITSAWSPVRGARSGRVFVIKG